MQWLPHSWVAYHGHDCYLKCERCKQCFCSVESKEGKDEKALNSKCPGYRSMSAV